MDISDQTKVSMPLKTVISIGTAVAVATWAYSGISNRITQLEMRAVVDETAIAQNTDFRIGWPRGEMGALPADMEQDMHIERLEHILEGMDEDVNALQVWVHGFQPPQEVKDAIADITELQARIRVLEAELAHLRNK